MENVQGKVTERKRKRMKHSLIKLKLNCQTN